MKAMFCLRCMEIRSPEPSGKQFHECSCGNLRVKWLNPGKGRLLVLAKELGNARVLGLNNQMLYTAMNPVPPSNEQWRQAHTDMCKSADGYIFHEEKRDCWACIVRPNDTTDIVWIGVKDDWTPRNPTVTIPEDWP